jgi:aminomuconate-semialdehyde/2-hydroxymuconate-6-semialdehyde dehydrogenase
LFTPTGPTAGAALVKHKDVPLISFTGGTKTAQHIITDSAPQYKKLGLELGGKNPNIIFDDADLTQAVPTRFVLCSLAVCIHQTRRLMFAYSPLLPHSVRSSFANQGEICLCGSRIFVQKGIYDKFVQQFVEAAKTIKVTRLLMLLLAFVSMCSLVLTIALCRVSLQVGDPKDPSSTMGALVSEEHLAKVNYYIDLARQEGGDIALGGDKPQLPDELKKGNTAHSSSCLRFTRFLSLSLACRADRFLRHTAHRLLAQSHHHHQHPLHQPSAAGGDLWPRGALAFAVPLVTTTPGVTNTCD